jgi:hypothetical protein
MQANGSESQEWIVKDDSSIHIVDADRVQASGFCLNVHCALEENGCKVNLWEANGHFSQSWNAPKSDSEWKLKADSHGSARTQLVLKKGSSALDWLVNELFYAFRSRRLHLPKW